MKLVSLYLGRNIPESHHADFGPQVSPEAFRAFLNVNVSPSFPAGYTVIQGQGAWRDAATGNTISEDTTILQFVVEGKVIPEIREIAKDYKACFYQDAVLMTVVDLASADLI
jgi:hypothetical protein